MAKIKGKEVEALTLEYLYNLIKSIKYIGGPGGISTPFSNYEYEVVDDRNVLLNEVEFKTKIIDSGIMLLKKFNRNVNFSNKFGDVIVKDIDYVSLSIIDFKKQYELNEHVSSNVYNKFAYKINCRINDKDYGLYSIPDFDDLNNIKLKHCLIHNITDNKKYVRKGTVNNILGIGLFDRMLENIMQERDYTVSYNDYDYIINGIIYKNIKDIVEKNSKEMSFSRFDGFMANSIFNRGIDFDIEGNGFVESEEEFDKYIKYIEFESDSIDSFPTVSVEVKDGEFLLLDLQDKSNNKVNEETSILNYKLSTFENNTYTCLFPTERHVSLNYIKGLFDDYDSMEKLKSFVEGVSESSLMMKCEFGLFMKYDSSFSKSSFFGLKSVYIYSTESNKAYVFYITYPEENKNAVFTLYVGLVDNFSNSLTDEEIRLKDNMNIKEVLGDSNSDAYDSYPSQVFELDISNVDIHNFNRGGTSLFYYYNINSKISEYGFYGQVNINQTETFNSSLANMYPEGLFKLNKIHIKNMSKNSEETESNTALF